MSTASKVKEIANLTHAVRYRLSNYYILHPCRNWWRAGKLSGSRRQTTEGLECAEVAPMPVSTRHAVSGQHHVARIASDGMQVDSRSCDSAKPKCTNLGELESFFGHWSLHKRFCEWSFSSPSALPHCCFPFPALRATRLRCAGERPPRTRPHEDASVCKEACDARTELYIARTSPVAQLRPKFGKRDVYPNLNLETHSHRNDVLGLTRSTTARMPPIWKPV